MTTRLVVRAGAALLVLVALVAGAGLALAKSRPETGQTGAAAEALTTRVEQAVRMDLWAQTGAVAWTLAGRNEHLWDRERGLSRVRWGGVEVLQRTDQRVGRVWRNGREIHGAARARLVQKAWETFLNDRHWLQPFASLHDDGVTRSVVEWSGTEALFVEYASGGVTPGDAYLWLLDDSGRPSACHMWVQVVPIGGLRSTWDDWVTLPTGAKVATRHRLGVAKVSISDLRAAPTLSELEGGADPFERLVSW